MGCGEDDIVLVSFQSVSKGMVSGHLDDQLWEYLILTTNDPWIIVINNQGITGNVVKEEDIWKLQASVQMSGNKFTRWRQ